MLIPSFNVFSSVSCWAIVLLHALSAVCWNSYSGFCIAILEDLCLLAVVGKVAEAEEQLICGREDVV